MATISDIDPTKAHVWNTETGHGSNADKYHKVDVDALVQDLANGVPRAIAAGAQGYFASSSSHAGEGKKGILATKNAWMICHPPQRRRRHEKEMKHLITDQKVKATKFARR